MSTIISVHSSERNLNITSALRQKPYNEGFYAVINIETIVNEYMIETDLTLYPSFEQVYKLRDELEKLIEKIENTGE